MDVGSAIPFYAVKGTFLQDILAAISTAMLVLVRSVIMWLLYTETPCVSLSLTFLCGLENQLSVCNLDIVFNRTSQSVDRSFLA